MASSGDEDQVPPEDPVTVSTLVIDAGTKIMQRRLPVKQMNTHVSTFAIYGGRHVQANRDSPVTTISTESTMSSSSAPFSPLIVPMHLSLVLFFSYRTYMECQIFLRTYKKVVLTGIEYVISDRLYENLPQEEQKLWHSHAYEVNSGSWAYPRLPEVVASPELKNIAKTYGKFWGTWQIDRGDKLPMGAPELMMSPQGVGQGVLRPELVKRRDEKYNMSTDELKHWRAEIAEPEWINPMADYWKQHGKCVVLDIVTIEMNRNEQFP